jgi:serine/threonine-protein kinase
VLLAEDVPTGKLVALKILNEDAAESPETVARLRREGEMAARIRSEYVVDVLGAGRTEDGAPFLVQELLEGETLSERLEARGGRLSQGEAVALGIELLRALEDVHRAGVVHRDLKPENIFLSPPRLTGARVKLLDFGVAHVIGGDGIVQTHHGLALGTLAYMPPEQVLGQPIDARADLYAIGIVLHLLVTGALPFTGCAAVVVRAKCAGVAPSAETIGPDVDPALASILETAMRPDPAQRHCSARAFREALEAWVEGRRPSSGAQARRRSRHRPGSAGPRRPGGARRGEVRLRYLHRRPRRP